MSGCPHIDLSSPDSFRGGMPREAFAWLRREAPVFWHEDPAQGVGYWAVTRQKDVDFVSKNPQLFSSKARTCFLPEHTDEEIELMRTQLINLDPPEHLRFRRLVRTAFTPRAVDSYRERFHQVAQALVNKALDGGRCEFVADIACDLPLIAICELMGVPLDQRERLFELTNIMLGMDDPELTHSPDDAMAAMTEMFMMANAIALNHKENPQDDIVNVLLTGTVDDEPLSEMEFCNFFLMLMVAGIETTRNATSHGMRLLMEHPEQYRLLVAEPARIPDAVEEILRYNPPVIAFRRTATEDTQIGEQAVARGDKIVLFYGAASADESVFSEPDRFDITRPQREEVRNEHRAFGIGEHFCMGSHLARLNLELIFAEIVRHIREPRLDGEINWLRSNFINGIKAMPIAFEVAS